MSDEQRSSWVADETSSSAALTEFSDALGDDRPISSGYRLTNGVAGAAIVALGGVFVTGALGMPLQVGNIPGPGLFPLILGSILSLLGLVLTVQSLLATLSRGEDSTLPDRQGNIRLLTTAVATGAFVWILGWLGYAISMALYVVALLVFVGGRKWWSSGIIAVVFAMGTYLLFTLALGLPLPTAYFPFLNAIGL